MKPAAALGLVLLAFAAAGCGGEKSAAPVSAKTCSELVYGGEGKPDAIVVSDLPRRGYLQGTSLLMEDAIKAVLATRGYRAGDLRIGYQSCDDSTSDEPYDPRICEHNARSYSAAKDVIGVVGPVNSACVAAELPVLSGNAAGPLAMISPAATWSGLTRKTPDDPKAPGVFYPEGSRNFVRVVPSDRVQGRGVALLAARLGARRVALISQPGSYGANLGGPFMQEARAQGLSARNFEWGRAAPYTPLAQHVAAQKPQLVYLAGLPSLNGRLLLEDLRRELGRDVVIVGSDGFLVPKPSDYGRAGEGILIALTGVPPEKLPVAGRSFLRSFGKPAYLQRQAYGAPEAAQSTEVLLDAIAHSDGSRASVVDQLFKTDVKNGILGSFRFDRNGDIDPAAVAFLRIENGKAVVDRVVRVPARNE